MKATIAAMTLFLLIGCTERNVNTKSTRVVLEDGMVPLHEIEHEGCQYLHQLGSYSSGLTHKGNCTNPIHKCNHEVED